MRLSALSLSAAVLSAATATAQFADVDLRPSTATRTGPAPAPVASQLPPAPVNGSDACATADPLGSATGSISYDLTAATTGTDGQTSFTGGYCNYGCAEYGTGQVAVLTDVWFSWTAPSTARVRLTTCPNQNDTKIAVYLGPACPTGTACVGCNDDYHFIGGTTAGLLDSIVYFDATLGQQYLFQIGQSSFNTGAPGFAGTFNIDINPLYVTTLDDNAAEASINVGGAAVGNGHLGMNRYGNTGDVTTITAIQACWGWAGSTAHTNGNPAYIGLWADGPTQDGNPNDAVLLYSAPVVVTSANTDTFVSFPLPTPQTVNGIYFVGYGQIRSTTAGPNYAPFPLSVDNTVCDLHPALAWVSLNTPGANDLVNLAANTTPPTRLDTVCQAQGAFNGLYHGAISVRPTIQVGPPPLGSGNCFGDGTGAACPCANSGGAGRGCANSAAGSTGALLTATGVASLGADSVTLICADMTGPGLFFQANGLAPSPILFGDGLLCAAVGIIRLGVVFPPVGGGPMSYPGGLTPNPVSIGGAPINAGDTKHYQCWYRDAVAFCTASTFNTSNGVFFTWAP